MYNLALVRHSPDRSPPWASTARSSQLVAYSMSLVCLPPSWTPTHIPPTPPTPRQGAFESNSFRTPSCLSYFSDSLTFVNSYKEYIYIYSPPVSAILVFWTLFECKLFGVQTLCPLRICFLWTWGLVKCYLDNFFPSMCSISNVLSEHDGGPRKHSAGLLGVFLLTRGTVQAQTLLWHDPFAPTVMGPVLHRVASSPCCFQD